MRTDRQTMPYAMSDTYTDLATGNTTETEVSGEFTSHYLTRSEVTKNRYDASRRRAPSSYTVYGYDFTPPSGLAVQTFVPDRATPSNQGYSITWAGDLNARVSVLRTSDEDSALGSSLLRNRCEIKALLQLKDQKANLALTALEARKTADLITDRGMKLFRSYSNLRKGNLKKAYEALGLSPRNLGKDNARSILEIQYGWRPLMADIYGAAESIRKGVAKTGLLVKVSSRSSLNEVTQGTYPATERFNWRWKKVIDRRCQVVLWYRVDNPALSKASELGFVDPLSIVWELTPFSFLIDWIVPVGDFLSALSADAGTQFISGTSTFSTRVNLKQNMQGFTANLGGGRYTGDCSASVNEAEFRMNRVPYSSSPIPLPYYKNPLSFEHAVNALSLFRALR